MIGRPMADDRLARMFEMKRRAWCWGPAWAIMAAIFALSSMSTLPPSPGGMDDSVAHAAAYGLLGAALLRGLAAGRLRGVTLGGVWLAVLLATLYGVTDEGHQWFVPGRTAEVADLVADAAGAAVATGLIWGWRCWSIVSLGRP